VTSRIGVLGGTFDPIHLGHLILGEAARDQLNLEHVLFVPTGYSWRKAAKDVAPAADRVAMVQLAIAGNDSFAVSLVEVEREGPSYTDETLEEIGRQYPGAELYFILGRDALADLPNWKAPARIVELATLAVAERMDGDKAAGIGGSLPGLEARLVQLRMPGVAISASDIRRRAAEGRSLRYLVPDAVASYIAERGLYRGG
jgi:nicotinate-nucleotide adenylyltransferase